MVLPVVEAQSEHVADRAADDPLGVEARELARPTAGADQLALLVGDEERGIRRRVVVVEQLEQEAEPASRAAARLAPEAGVAIGRGGAGTAVGTDEEMRHDGPSGPTA